MVWIHPLRLPHAPHLAMTVPIVLGLAFGILTRTTLLASDAGPFPSRPHGAINAIFLGFVASVLGALAPPALLTQDYTAGVFLALGVSQLHTVRQVERAMLLGLDRSALVPRGHPLIEGQALALETRNYLVMTVALATTTLGLLFGPLPGAALGVLAAVFVPALATVGIQVRTRAEIRTVPVEHRGQALRLGGVDVIPTPSAEELDALPHAVGVRVTPHNLAARLTLAEPGQWQAILHHLTSRLGALVVPALGEDAPGQVRHLLPHAAVEPASGDLLILCFPQFHEPRLLMRAIGETPLLETISHRGLPKTGASG